MKALAATIILISTISFPMSSFAGKSIVSIYKNFESNMEKMCAKKYDRKESKKCVDMIIGAIKKDCGNKPWEGCMFDVNGDYIETGSRSWNKVQKLIDNAHKKLK